VINTVQLLTPGLSATDKAPHYHVNLILENALISRLFLPQAMFPCRRHKVAGSRVGANETNT
jgi:hypothetical protein